MEKEKKTVIEQHALDEIPKSERKSWLSIALIFAHLSLYEKDTKIK